MSPHLDIYFLCAENINKKTRVMEIKIFYIVFFLTRLQANDFVFSKIKSTINISF